jgi:putative ABC transport system permease protein
VDEWTRETGAAGWIDVLRQDARYTFRALRRDLGFTVVVILTLALGIGANTAVFSVVHSILLKPLPYQDPDRLMMIWTAIPGRGVADATSAYGNVRDWRAQSSAFEGMATFDPTTRTLTGGAWPERVMTADVSQNIFALLGVEPRIGRTFSVTEEEQRSAVAVVSHEFWQQRLGGSPGAIGSTIELSGAPFEVIGVMPPGFGFPEQGTQVWLPQTVLSGWEPREARRGTDSWRVVGRLGTDQTVEAAHRQMSEIASRLERAYPSDNAGLGVRVVPLHDQVTGSSFRVALWTLFGAVGLVLLVACANAAHLILARSLRRAREHSIRVALGGTTGRLIRLALTESLVISIAAGVLGVLTATVAVDLLASLAPASTPRIGEVGVSVTVLAFAIAISVATAAIFGLGPATRGARSAPFDELRESRGRARQGQRSRRLLVVGQLALAVVLVFGANLLIKSFLEARGVDLEFDPEGVLLANLSVESPTDRVPFYEQVVERVGGLPGVLATGIVEDLFISGAPNLPITVEGSEGAGPTREDVRIDAVDGDLFATVGAQLVAGRVFSAADGPTSPPVAIINETLARRLWPGDPAVGERFATGDPRSGAPWIEVVGVVADMRRQGFERAPIAQGFRPYGQAPSRNMNLLVRTDGPVPGLPTAIRAAIAEIDRTVPLYRVTTVEEALEAYLGPRRSQTYLLVIFSVIALVLAAIGIYGLVQYSVAQRTREIGVRLALGARIERVTLMVLGEGFLLAMVGLALGIGLALSISRVASALLFGVAPVDVTSLVMTSALLLATTLIACWVPARRAGRIDPVVALRDT